MQPILEIKNISKKFRIQHEQQPYLSLRDSISRLFTSPLGGNRRLGMQFEEGVEDFWALKDVSFDVYPGDSIGIIGKNGAGKSTLLKILSRITPPTSGKIISRGRIASLLEVGTGFHAELSGRENIFLNGSILGMKKHEIRKKFDEIVDFSGVEKFLDTPLKHYSSGMQLRLAFAVAAFLEPEILVIDEVLAVGDAEFQKKCLNKMENLTGIGRTVLFVSHNMAIIEKLCQRAVLLNNGKNSFSGQTHDVCKKYLESNSINATPSLLTRTDRTGTGEILITNIEIRDQENNLLDVVQSGQTINISLKYKVSKNMPVDKRNNITISIAITTLQGTYIVLHHNRLTGTNFTNLDNEGAFNLSIKDLPLNENTYFIKYNLMQNTSCLDSLDNAHSINVIGKMIFNYKELPPGGHGPILINGEWTVNNHH